MQALGIDVGGSGIKAALVDTGTGSLVSERIRIDTPKPSTPKAVTETIGEIVGRFDYQGTIGVSFPTVIVDNKALTPGNLDPSWTGNQLDKLFESKTGHKYTIHNDADLAGIAEMRMGAGVGKMGTVIMITIGTGLGSGVFRNGILIPNIELGRIFGLDGEPIEFYAGDRARKKNDLSWSAWGKRFNFFLRHIERVCTPDLFILGGGASKKFHKYAHKIDINVPIEIAKFRNNAGIIGAAMTAVEP